MPDLTRFIFRSGPGPDRNGFITDMDGWDLSAFLLNPVILFAHKSRELPIGRAHTIGIINDQMVGDIEFAVQYLQLVHGKEHLRLRCPNTFGALSALSDLGLLSSKALSALREAYLFYRRVESRLRIMDERTVNVVDRRQPALLLRLARALGYIGRGPTSEAALFLAEVDRHAARVRNTYRDVLLGGTG